MTKDTIRYNGMFYFCHIPPLILRLALWLPILLWAKSFHLASPNVEVVGEVFTIHSQPGDNLRSIGSRYDIGLNEMKQANPRLNPFKLKPWSEVTIPTAYILPHGPRVGVVINLPEHRLYYYAPEGNLVSTYPIGVGRDGWETPLGITDVTEKIIDPPWRVPDSIKQHMLKKFNKHMPDVIAPGPNNPLGKYALRLGIDGYLIHGTNAPNSIGLQSSSGCIRLIPQHIQRLFKDVPIGTKVTIIHHPYKFGRHKGRLYFEAHKPLGHYQKQPHPLSENFHTMLSKMKAPKHLWQQSINIKKRHLGYPQMVGEYNEQ